MCPISAHIPLSRQEHGLLANLFHHTDFLQRTEMFCITVVITNIEENFRRYSRISHDQVFLFVPVGFLRLFSQVCAMEIIL
jgi:hypothetical protein